MAIFTPVTTKTTGDLYTAALFNSEIKDNFTNHETRIVAVEATRSVYRSYQMLAIDGYDRSINGLKLNDGFATTAWTDFVMPNDFDTSADDAEINIVIYSASGGNCYASLVAYYGAFSATQAISAISYTIGTYQDIITIGIPSVSRRDLVRVEFIRNSSSALDTVDDDMYIPYLRLEYTGTNYG